MGWRLRWGWAKQLAAQQVESSAALGNPSGAGWWQRCGRLGRGAEYRGAERSPEETRKGNVKSPKTKTN